MSTLKEQRMINAHQLGRRNFNEGKPMLVPQYISESSEIEAYRAGFIQERKRMVRIINNPDQNKPSDTYHAARTLCAGERDYCPKLRRDGSYGVWCDTSDHWVTFD